MVRPLTRREVRFEFWELYRAGVSVEVAGGSAGVSARVAREWIHDAGGVAPKRQRSARRCVRLSFAEREEIAIGRAAGGSVRSIAAVIGRSPSTVAREITRNSSAGGYRASMAEGYAIRRALRPKVRKLAGNVVLARVVQDGLLKRHSPRQISARLKRDFGDDPGMQISHEAIYQSLYVQGRGGLRRELHQCLRTGRALRRPQKRAQDQGRGRIPNMMMISERPAEIEDRAVPGHWEGDLIIGKNNKSAIGTLVERSTRFVMLLHLPIDHTAEAVRDQMIATIATLPDTLARSVTWDQGKEMAAHAQITLATDIDIYFCDPHSPWQRGSNENTNGLLRQYFPKGTDLSIHSRQHLDFVAAELNERPRETLGWDTPAERLNKLLSQAA